MSVDRLPRPLTSFLGRDEELRRVVALVEEHRLVTLTGPGGVGKTRLAIESGRVAAGRFAEGGWFVDLAAVRDGEAVPAAIRAALGASEAPGDPVSALTELIGDRELLLIVDNCEQVVEGAAVAVGQALESCPGLRVLATSREPLGVPGELVWRVQPLELASDADPLKLAEFERLPVIRLFVERARLASPAFKLTAENAPYVLRICSAVDFLPLGVELAAARLRTLPVAQVADRLVERLATLAGGARTAPERQRTMEGAVRWSYELLTEPEQRLFRRLGVFTGGWTLEAAEGVCGFGGLAGADVFPLLEALVDRSLVVASPESDGRFRFLEVILEFARHELQRHEDGDLLRGRHCRWFRELGERAEPHLDGPSTRYWLDLIEPELQNLRTALAWARDSQVSRGDGLLLVGRLQWFWNDRGYLREACEAARELLDRAGRPTPSERLAALRMVSWGAIASLESDAGAAAAAEAAEIARELNDDRSLTAVLETGAVCRVYSHNLRGAREWATEAAAVAERIGSDIAVARAWWALSLVEDEEGHTDAASALIEKAMPLAELCGSPHLRAMVHVSAGENARRRGDLREATRCYERAEEIARSVGILRMRGLTRLNLALTDIQAKNFPRALTLARSVMEAPDTTLGGHVGVIVALGVAAIDAEQGNAARAASWLAAFDEGRAISVDSTDMGILEAALDRCRARLGEEFESAYGRGLGMEPKTLIREVRARLAEEPPVIAPEAPARLSSREVEILRLVAAGESNQAIAERLVLSRRTVENHVANAYAKIGATNRVEAVRFAIEHGLTPAGPA